MCVWGGRNSLSVFTPPVRETEVGGRSPHPLLPQDGRAAAHPGHLIRGFLPRLRFYAAVCGELDNFGLH